MHVTWPRDGSVVPYTQYGDEIHETYDSASVHSVQKIMKHKQFLCVYIYIYVYKEGCTFNNSHIGFFGGLFYLNGNIYYVVSLSRVYLMFSFFV